MTDDVPNWFGEPAEESTHSVDPPTIPADWFSDIESDEIPPAGSSLGTAASSTQASAGPAETTRDAATEADADKAESSGAESSSPEPKPSNEPTAAQASTAKMDGTQESAAEVGTDSTDDESDGGFVAWLKSLFGL
jgi:hypothetical protein